MLHRIPDADLVQITKKKPAYDVSRSLGQYLREFGRTMKTTIHYQELMAFHEQIPIYNQSGRDTMWETVMYTTSIRNELEAKLCNIYALLMTEGNPSFLPHLFIDRIDFCEFGNSQPFRIRVMNRFNDNHDYYYVKRADASRIYGLELEHILAPNRINFMVHSDTLVEEHITGIPGDVFIDEFMLVDSGRLINPIRVAKEFVKFNERCFAKLLGDMRSYNYVLVLTQDFDAQQYRVRAIDFDRQCHEGELKVYFPQFYRENQPVVELVWDSLPRETIQQYQSEERSLMRRRAHTARVRLEALFGAMDLSNIAPPENVHELAAALAKYHRDQSFESKRSMGSLTRTHLHNMLES